MPTTLHEILWNLRNEDLAYRFDLLGIKPRPTRKADLVEGLKNALSGEGLEAIWNSLDELEQATVRETCYAPDLSYDPSKIRAKYGALPSFCDLPDNQRGFGSSLWNRNYATRLNLLLFMPRDSRERVVPSDVAERLRTFIPKPAAMGVPTLDNPPPEEDLLIRETEPESLAEVIALLRLAELGKLRISAKTGSVSSAVARDILECLSNGDFFPESVTHRPGRQSYEQEIGPIKPIGWARLLQVGGYLTRDGTQSKLSTSGKKALSQPPHEVIRQIWKKWLANTNYDEFNRIDDIKGQRRKGHMTAKPPRRSAIVASLSECPEGQWICAEKFSDYMQATGHRFEVSRDPWKLYLCDSQYGSLGYDGYGGWNIIQFRYLLCFLFEYAATLGLIDIAYVHPRDGLKDYRGQWGADELEWLSRYDGLRTFRITALGAYCLGINSDYQPAPMESSLKLSVYASLRIHVLSGTPSPGEKLLLDTWAEAIEPGVWQLEATRGGNAVESGQEIADFQTFLQQYDSQPLPDTVVNFLQSCETDGRALESRGEAELFECRDSATVELICAQSEFPKSCLRCGETFVAVPTAHLPKFRKVVRSLGLGINSVSLSDRSHPN